MSDLLCAKHTSTILCFLIYGCMGDSGTAISARQERTGGYSCTCWRFRPLDYCRALMSGITSLPRILWGIFPSTAGCCDTSGSTNARKKKKILQHKGERTPHPLRTFPKAAVYPASASAFFTSTSKPWRSRFHLVNHLVQVLNPPPFIISWQGDGGKT